MPTGTGCAPAIPCCRSCRSVPLGLRPRLATGRLGFMPLDQSIVFDGAWRLLSGQVPFRDFTTPDGLTPIVLQALFFQALGVTWFAYCLHAAVFNGLFCCLAYGLLRGIGAPRAAALLYGALSGVVFYPSLWHALQGSACLLFLPSRDPDVRSCHESSPKSGSDPPVGPPPLCPRYGISLQTDSNGLRCPCCGRLSGLGRPKAPCRGDEMDRGRNGSRHSNTLASGMDGRREWGPGPALLL